MEAGTPGEGTPASGPSASGGKGVGGPERAHRSENRQGVRIDEDCDTRERCYADNDRDGHGTPDTVPSLDLDCAAPGESTLSDDCDDASATVYPLAPEITADGIDQDCNAVDLCYTDSDGDGYGSTSTVVGTTLDCSAPGESTVATDCDDTSAAVYPAAPELPANDTDEDCDGTEHCYVDNDNDTFGTAALVSSGDLACADAGLSTVATDCDDTDDNVYPGASEALANGIDEDCDGTDLCYADVDHDGYGDDADVTTAESTDLDCVDLGEASNSDDCDDTNVRVRPGAPETAANGVDEDCDGAELCYVDEDGDGSGSGQTALGDLACTGSPLDTSDCDDADPDVSPAAQETCNGLDDNCNGQADEGLHCVDAVPLIGCATVAPPGAGLGAALALVALSARRRGRQRN